MHVTREPILTFHLFAESRKSYITILENSSLGKDFKAETCIELQVQHILRLFYFFISECVIEILNNATTF